MVQYGKNVVQKLVQKSTFLVFYVEVSHVIEEDFELKMDLLRKWNISTKNN